MANPERQGFSEGQALMAEYQKLQSDLDNATTPEEQQRIVSRLQAIGAQLKQMQGQA